MNECIQWCNENNGFLTAILALLSLFISVWAVVVSIQTAKLPYKKRLLHKVDFQKELGLEEESGRLNWRVTDICVNAINTGNRTINLTFFGFGYTKNSKFYTFRSFFERKKTIVNKKQKLKLSRLVDQELGTGCLMPSQSIVVHYDKERIRDFWVTRTEKEKSLYAYALDTEGWEYYCKFDTVQITDENNRSCSNKENKKTKPCKQKNKAKAS